MDEKKFLKKFLPKALQESESDEEKNIFKKMNLQATVKFNKLQNEYSKISPDNLVENFRKKVNEYNRKKQAEYYELMKTIQDKEKNYYEYFKKYEKKHGWQKTTDLLESFGSMKRWLDFNVIFKKLDYYDKLTKKKKRLEEPEIEMPKEKEIEFEYPEIEDIQSIENLPTPEELIKEQILSEQKMQENLNNNLPEQTLRQFLQNLDFTPEEIESILKQLSPSEMATLMQRVNFEMGEESVTNPGGGKSPATVNNTEDSSDFQIAQKKLIVHDILWHYGVMY